MIKALIIVISLSFIVPCFGGCIKEETSPVNGNTQPETPPQAGSIIWHIGDKWEWKRNDNKTGTDEVINIIFMNQYKCYEVVSKEDVVGKVYYETQSLGTYITDSPGMWRGTFTPPEMMILPVENKTYTSTAYYDIPSLGVHYINETTIVRYYGIENVVVPAGKFKVYNISIEMVDENGGGTGPIQIWFSPEVKNFVKRHIFWGNNTYILTSYELH